MKQTFTLLILSLFILPVYSQIYTPNIYKYDKLNLTAGNDSSKSSNILVGINLNGGLREIASLKSDSEEKFNGSLFANFSNPNKWAIGIGYVLNKVNENTITSKDHYYNSLINPEFGGQAFLLEVNYFIYEKSIIGLYSNFAIGIDEWTIANKSYSASPYQFKLSVMLHPLKNYETPGKDKINVLLKGGYVRKAITGSLSAENDLLFKNFGTNITSLNGIELNVDLIFNDISLFFSPTWYLNTKNEVDFPQNGIYTIGVNVSGEFLNFELVKR